METKRYTVTDRAGPKVAGYPAPDDKILELTAAEAEHELLAGTIVLEGQELHKAFTEKTRKVEAAQAAATPPAPVEPAGGGDKPIEPEKPAKPAKLEGGSKPA